jgi:hypothetical protein
MSFVGAAIGLAPTAQSQAGLASPTNGVPPRYAGSWVCQSAQPGYNITPPHADPSRPATSTLRTPPTVVVHKFTLGTDGTYEASNARGTYSFDPATKAITWLAGPHLGTVTKTELSQRANGAPSIGFVLSNRYYGCFMPQPPSKR